MSDGATTLRRGLPRRPGVEPWPPVTSAPPAAARHMPPPDPAPAAADGATAPATAASGATAPATAPAAAAGGATAPGLRRGLPRVAGGPPWPDVDASPVRIQPEHVSPQGPAPELTTPSEEKAVSSTSRTTAPAAAAGVPRRAVTRTETRRLRQGLPRVAGAGSWPSVSEVQVEAEALPEVHEPEPSTSQQAADVVAADALSAGAAPTPTPTPTHESADAAPSLDVRPRRPLKENAVARVAMAAAGLIVVAAAAVLATRWLLGFDAMQSFLQTYPGEYHLPDNAPVGLPAWLGWQHFLNVFLMVLIIKSGIQIRREKRPSAYWTPKGKSDGKVSLTIWFHQSLDALWLANGIIFIVLLFVTGQWMRVVPTSWEVLPNAVSAALQYISLDWPTDNGWVNYNSLQQLAYFTTIFVAAPLAAASGFRMSGLWPKRMTKLSALYPIEAARKIHFPVMLYFVAFIAVHVILVIATGALRNLNHMYAAQGSTDPTAYAANWFGFWMFVLSLLVIGGAVVASRPFLLAQVAKLFGTVSSR